MQTGRYKHLVTIQSKTATTDAYGGTIFTWADVCTVWARVLPMTVRGRELIAAGAEQREGMVRFYIRYRSDIDASMRIVWQGRNHDIDSPPADLNGEGKELEILAKVGANAG